MRGKVLALVFGSVAYRFTPAYAGKSMDCFSEHAACWDHPRVCGEKCHSRLSAASALGSPPRMRGKEIFTGALPSIGRITPAYAGKRPSIGMVTGSFEDHPRVCGEKKPKNRTATTSAGSPPRMRGKDGSRPTLVKVEGITPAYAGDHPRVCGEKTEKIP